MDTAAELINRFYTAFQQLDFRTMNSCYSEHPVFSDPVFMLLEGDEVGAMWEMLCKNARNFSLDYSPVEILDDEYVTCKWTATYTFSATGRTVVNKVKGHFRIIDGKIAEHSDAFRLSAWAAQALGWKGVLFGRMTWMQKIIKKRARKNLELFIAQKGLEQTAV